MKPDGMLLLISLFLLTSSGVLAQSGERGQSPVSPRVTPLGTQRPKPSPPEKKTQPENPEKPAEIIERAVNAHGGRQALASVRDSISEGKLTFFTGKIAKNTLDVTVIRKGTSRVQRLLKDGDEELHQGSDGTSTWEAFNGMTALAPGGLAGNYIESQTVRAVDVLFDAQGKGLQVRDAGTKDKVRVLEVEATIGQQTRKTKYSIDDATSRVTEIEFVTGEAKDLLGRTIPATESYRFSDFRTVQGVRTPFRIERYIHGLKIEETQFTSVRYNASVKDEDFKP